MPGALAELWTNYNLALENGDPRTDPWPLVHSPVPVILLLLLYLFLVLVGPRAMSLRPPLGLTGPLVTYNLGLVLLSGYMFYEFLTTSLLANYSYFCQPVDSSQSELSMRMACVCWWCFFSKAIELLDTVFLVLRKKQKQLTFLHVYHHGTMLLNWWAGVKYVPGGQAFFVGMLNSLVHIFMYLYYGLASLGPQVRPYLWWKRYLTVLQLVRIPLGPWVQGSIPSSALDSEDLQLDLSKPFSLLHFPPGQRLIFSWNLPWWLGLEPGCPCPSSSPS
ncbi:elongation of very long chain fatty acids protein 4-like isoform X3 [Suncus etruscus]|nr:elongation of very long chain fatty acids protein 4-like isoform X3 [Suncus etruscus]